MEIVAYRPDIGATAPLWWAIAQEGVYWIPLLLPECGCPDCLADH